MASEHCQACTAHDYEITNAKDFDAMKAATEAKRRHRIRFHLNKGVGGPVGDHGTPMWRDKPMPTGQNNRDSPFNSSEVDDRVRKLLDY